MAVEVARYIDHGRGRGALLDRSLREEPSHVFGIKLMNSGSLQQYIARTEVLSAIYRMYPTFELAEVRAYANARNRLQQLKAHDVTSVRVRDGTQYIDMMNRSQTICPESQIIQTGYLVYFEIWPLTSPL